MSSVKKSTKSAKAKAGRSKSAARSSRASESSTRKARTTAARGATARAKTGKVTAKISKTKQTDKAKTKARAAKSARTLPSKAKAKSPRGEPRHGEVRRPQGAGEDDRQEGDGRQGKTGNPRQAGKGEGRYRQADHKIRRCPGFDAASGASGKQRRGKSARPQGCGRSCRASEFAHRRAARRCPRAGKAQAPLTAKAPEAAKPAEAVQPQTRIPDGRPAGGLISKNIKPGTPKAGFKTLEFIVYPAHGVGQIIAIEEQEVAGFKLELFVISFVKDKMILKVPTPKSVSVGMRKLAGPEVVKRALDTLTGRARIKRTMWSRRAQEYEAKINSGDLVSIAEVVRDLYRSDAQPEQSYSERQLYEAALDRVAREIAVVQKLTETESLKLIELQLQKGPRRGKPEEGEAEAEAEGEAPAEGDVDEAEAA